MTRSTCAHIEPRTFVDDSRIHYNNQRCGYDTSVFDSQCYLISAREPGSLPIAKRGYGATAARLTPDQKVGSSNLSGLISQS
jgi:hypothetical protein